MLLKLLAIEAIILIGQVILYFGCEIFQDKNNYHSVKRAIDDKIPQIPMFGFVYIMWFPMIIFYPVSLYSIDERSYVLYQLSIIISILISVVFYVIYPTSFVREKPRDAAGSWLLKIIYFFSYKGVNCSPSLHCAHCYIVILSVFTSGLAATPVGIGLILLSLAIVASTVLTKQHCMLDMATAIPLVVVSAAISIAITNNYFEQIINAVNMFLAL